MKNCLKIWNQFRWHFRLQVIFVFAPIHSNPLFTPSIIDKAFWIWKDLGIVSIKQLYISGIFASFDQLTQTFNLQPTHFFRYLQVRDFVRHNFPGLYNTLLKSQTTTADVLRNAWSAELGEDIGPAAWEHALSWVHSSSICARHGVLQCKVIHRVHWSKSKLARIYPDIDPNCDKCHQGPADLSHMFWSCPTLAPFWACVFDSLSATTSARIQPSPLLALFGVLPIGPEHVCTAILTRSQSAS